MTLKNDPSVNPFAVTAVILAGGRASRMGGKDKGWVELCGRPLIEHVYDKIAPQVDEVLINANRNQARYQTLAPVVGDENSLYLGPLAGMQAGLCAARHDWVLFVPCDGPAIPNDLVRRLQQSITPATPLAVAHDGEHLQPVVALLHRSLLPSLQRFLAAGERKIDIWFGQHTMAVVYFDAQTFINLNTPAELARYQAGLNLS